VPRGPLPQTLVASREIDDLPDEGYGMAGAVTTALERDPAADDLCRLRTRTVAGGVEVALNGELCFSTAPGIELQLHEIERRGRLQSIDLRGLGFIDLAGLDMVGRSVARSGSSGRPPRSGSAGPRDG
jgi:hypothetical protein